MGLWFWREKSSSSPGWGSEAAISKGFHLEAQTGSRECQLKMAHAAVKL